MSDKIRTIPGLHECGAELNLRVSKDPGKGGEHPFWLIFGVCDQCRITVFFDVLVQETEPIPGVDYVIDPNLRLIDSGCKTLEELEGEIKKGGADE